MPEPGAQTLRTLAAATTLSAGKDDRLAVNGGAALLETFYTGVEKVLGRIARAFGGMPEGPEWRRTLLEHATLDVPKVRPAVLSAQAVAALEDFLGFRHRFRNLYLFDLRPALVLGLLEEVPAAWGIVAPELDRFAQRVEAMADALESDRG